MKTLKLWWFGFWIRMAYLFNLRKLACYVGRWWFKEKKMEPIPEFGSPEEAQQYLMARFQYRHDRIQLQLMGKSFIFPVDWVSDPRHFQAKLIDEDVRDGDCDDVHMWAAAVLSLMESVEEVYLLSSGFLGGAHATVVYKQGGKWKHFDYQIYDIDSPDDAPMEVAKRYTHGYVKEVTFWVFEKVHWPNVWKPSVICPTKLVK